MRARTPQRPSGKSVESVFAKVLRVQLVELLLFCEIVFFLATFAQVFSTRSRSRNKAYAATSGSTAERRSPCAGPLTSGEGTGQTGVAAGDLHEGAEDAAWNFFLQVDNNGNRISKGEPWIGHCQSVLIMCLLEHLRKLLGNMQKPLLNGQGEQLAQGWEVATSGALIADDWGPLLWSIVSMLQGDEQQSGGLPTGNLQQNSGMSGCVAGSGEAQRLSALQLIGVQLKRDSLRQSPAADAVQKLSLL